MNRQRLRIYLEDHIALMVGESELVARCLSSNKGTVLADFLNRLDSELVSQKSAANEILERLESKKAITGVMKQGAAWFAEKLGRFKLNDSFLTYSVLSRVIELETLAAAAHERVALWDNLEVVGTTDPQLENTTAAVFREQAQQHFDELNRNRRTAAKKAFSEDT